MNTEAIIIFVKNFVPGKVKTRLAATIGEDKALDLYRELVKINAETLYAIQAKIFVFYDSYIPEEDLIWTKHDYIPLLQEGNDLGERMKCAFEKVSELGYERVLLIGSDCPDISTEIIHSAFKHLEEVPCVLGPATDGGYYLIGFELFDYPEVFQDITWSSSNVLDMTLSRLIDLEVAWYELPMLSDIDTEEDWDQYQRRSKLKHAMELSGQADERH